MMLLYLDLKANDKEISELPLSVTTTSLTVQQSKLLDFWREITRIPSCCSILYFLALVSLTNFSNDAILDPDAYSTNDAT